MEYTIDVHGATIKIEIPINPRFKKTYKTPISEMNWVFSRSTHLKINLLVAYH